MGIMIMDNVGMGIRIKLIHHNLLSISKRIISRLRMLYVEKNILLYSMIKVRFTRSGMEVKIEVCL
jgi:hypothetical protein